jgi:hypothetical protein
MFPFKLHVPTLTASLNVLFRYSSDHTHPKGLQFFVQRLTSVFSKKCTIQTYTHQVHMLFIAADNTNPILLLQGHVTKILTTYPSPSSPFSCFPGLRPRDPFRLQNNKPEDSVTDVLCSFFPPGLYFITFCVESRSIHSSKHVVSIHFYVCVESRSIHSTKHVVSIHFYNC